MSGGPRSSIPETLNRRRLLGVAAVGSVLTASRSTVPAPGWGPRLAEIEADVARGREAPERLQWTSILAFLSPAQRAAAAAGRTVDCTAAFAAALKQEQHVWIPPGRYGVSTIRLLSGCSLVGAGTESTIIEQLAPDRPAIACVADASTGQVAGVTLAGVQVRGHAAATECAVLVVGEASFAIWRSTFQFFASRCAGALRVGVDNTNVFRCDFDVVSEGSRGTAVVVRGGVYNRYRYFLSQTAAMALEDHSSSSEIEVVAESCLTFSGQMNRIWATVEGIVASPVPSRTVIEDRGFENRFFSPTVNLRAEDRGKCTYAFAAFAGSRFDDPQILGRGTVEHPFAPTSQRFAVAGGRSEARQPIEAVFDGAGPDRNLRNVALTGTNQGLTRTALGIGARAIQRAAPAGPFNFAINPRTDVVIWEPTAPIGLANVSLMGGIPPFDGWMITFSTTQPVARINWPGGAAFGDLPTRIDPGAGFTILYDQAGARWRRA